MNQRREKIALVTGANRGIGREIAGQLALRGFRVFIGARDKDSAERAVVEIQAGGGQAVFLPLDVSDSGSIRAAAGEFANHTAHLDVLVNNAGIYPDRGVNIVTVSRELLTRTFQTNTFGPVEVTQAFLPWLASR